MREAATRRAALPALAAALVLLPMPLRAQNDNSTNYERSR